MSCTLCTVTTWGGHDVAFLLYKYLSLLNSSLKQSIMTPIAAAVGVVGGVVHDQGEADDDMSVKQRLMLAGGSTLAEGGGAVRDLTGVDAAGDALEVAGKKEKTRHGCH